MWKRFWKFMLTTQEYVINETDKRNSFNDNCDKVIKELQCNLTAEEIYETLVNKEVVLEIHNGVVEVHKKSKGVKIYIKDYDIENEVHDKNYVESNYDADIEI